MGEPELPKIDELAEELEFCRVFREVHQAKGIDIAKFYRDLAIYVQVSFFPRFKLEFKQICDAGCPAEGLGILIAILKRSPDLIQDAPMNDSPSRALLSRGGYSPLCQSAPRVKLIRGL
jgi:hypothetical protein